MAPNLIATEKISGELAESTVWNIRRSHKLPKLAAQARILTASGQIGNGEGLAGGLLSLMRTALWRQIP